MKATGIVRRIDDLGRIVIPKEIRRTLHIRETDPLLTSLTEFGKADKQGVCEDSKVPGKENKALVEERIGQIKRELFVGGMIGLAERVGKG
jgi:AbrB family looped-hinge helix DNA binding protein